MEHRIERILDAPVPDGGNQLVEVFRHLDLHVLALVIEVPKISSSPRRSRRRQVPLVQTAEQLVEVPSIVSFSLLQRIMEQNVDIPVPGEGGPSAGLQGFPLAQSSAGPSAQIVDIPVSGGGLQGFFCPGHGGFWKNFLSWVCLRCSHLEIGTLFLCDLVSGSLYLDVWVLHVECGTLDSSGDDFGCSAMLGSTMDTCSASVLGFG